MGITIMKKSTLVHKLGVSVGTLSYLSLCISGAVFAQSVSAQETSEEEDRHNQDREGYHGTRGRS